jgi:hypothetical protein
LVADLNAPTPQRRRRSSFAVGPAVATETGPARAGSRVYRAVSTVERLLRLGTITPRQAEAANRLRDDYELGVAGAREPASGSTGSVGWHYAEARLAAVCRYQAAIGALGAMAHWVLLVALGEPGLGDVSISAIARRIARNRQEVAGLVKFGLDVLADHYGIDNG